VPRLPHAGPASDRVRRLPVVDAVGGTSAEAHRAALERVVQAGARPVSWVQVICELQRDWARTETVPTFREILFGPRPVASLRVA
jgi:nicotinamidase-related amidase